jgi:hypothetical protein
MTHDTRHTRHTRHTTHTRARILKNTTTHSSATNHSHADLVQPGHARVGPHHSARPPGASADPLRPLALRQGLLPCLLGRLSEWGQLLVVEGQGHHRVRVPRALSRRPMPKRFVSLSPVNHISRSPFPPRSFPPVATALTPWSVPSCVSCELRCVALCWVCCVCCVCVVCFLVRALNSVRR